MASQKPSYLARLETGELARRAQRELVTPSHVMPQYLAACENASIEAYI